MLWDLYEVRNYRMLQSGHFLELKSYLESEAFAVKKHEDLTTTGYFIASRRGLNVNWKSYVEYKWTAIESGAYRVSLRYFARWRPLLSTAAAVLTVGISAATGVATYTSAIREAENFFDNMWLRLERYALQPEERIVLEKSGFGRYEPQWTEEEQRVMASHGMTAQQAPGTAMPGTLPAAGPTGIGASHAVPGTTSAAGGVPGYVAAPGNIVSGEAFTQGFGGEPSLFAQQTEVKMMHHGARIGESIVGAGPTTGTTGTALDPTRQTF